MDEVKFEQDLVRTLLRDQHPDLADLELRDINGGWDNQQWRLGEELAVRLPRTERAPALLHIEQTWLPVLANRLPLPTPIPVRIGKPSSLFEHIWTIARWVEGEPADHVPVTRIDAAEVLAEFLGALHIEAPADAPANPVRGIPLARLREGVDGGFKIIADHPSVKGAREVWEKAVAAPVWQGAPLWLHGDLHPANVVVRDGMLAGVIDFGEMCAGDPATDLSAAWILLPAGAASRFFDAYGQVDEATITRARGWAVLRALGMIRIGQNGRIGLPGGKPTWEPAGFATLERVLATN
ncbi:MULTISPECIES: aminoglycoside phosphotransferase family protein [unclassified Rhodococcus (in: high G+C Gram-positive bacteria)]|uniref:aminoglycoside phosphotransferase family protein n=1 Tax=unclassified Rhodococcus (in: high G+C Gram-positive bacteria) TaxID=192944 RepID=UPI001639D627|nr:MULTISPECIES: aminoglycoside phosphotransferase family protein [unclassified Rhodococcus (in: high G+C Gram-positive bacteria)]MBC2644433.1 aminoglycoside phosphotransferase family protein [Rhodococcus sp. 3A]MBC2897875.1 aminoglycoside phosphotransferase family protein [Rhodococcus sp. 4CII]